MPILTKEEILAKSFRKEKIDVPEWGGEVYIRYINCMQREAISVFSQKYLEAKTTESSRNFVSALIATCICDERGAAIFSENEIPGLESGVIDRLAAECLKVNGMATEKKSAE